MNSCHRVANWRSNRRRTPQTGKYTAAVAGLDYFTRKVPIRSRTSVASSARMQASAWAA
jgi:hypothetical protein